MNRLPVPKGERELDILQALWGLGRPATVTEVREAFGREGGSLAYTTIQTMLNRLVDKGVVTRDDRERAHLYSPRLGRPAALRSALAAMVRRFFQGSPESMAAHLVDSELTPEQLERLSRAIETRRRALSSKHKR